MRDFEASLPLRVDECFSETETDERLFPTERARARSANRVDERERDDLKIGTRLRDEPIRRSGA